MIHIDTCGNLYFKKNGDFYQANITKDNKLEYDKTNLIIYDKFFFTFFDAMFSVLFLWSNDSCKH